MKKNRPLKSKMILIFTMLLSAFLSMQTIEVNASHFRGGTITWQQAGGNSITFTVNTQWRRSAFGGQTVGSTNNIGTFYYGDGTTAIMIATVNATNIANDESFMTWTITKTYASSGNFTASAFTDIAGGICCRINGVLDGNNGGYRLETVVNVGGPPFNNPPVTSLPAIVNLPVGAANATFTIPGSDPDNNPLTFRVSTTAESGLSTIQPAGFNLSSNGTATMNTTTRVVGNQFAVQVMILDGRTKTPVDFIIRMVAASAPPVFIAPSPAQNAIFNVTPPGNNINFTVAATDPDAGQTTTLNSVALPLGAAMSPALPVTSSASGVIQSTFNWTPTAAQVGSYVVNFVAQDNVGIQSFRTITINVQCPLSITVTGTVIPTCVNTNNGSISVSVQNFSTSSNLRYLWTGPGTFTSTQQNLSGLSSGTYNLRVDDVGTGCFSLTTINLNSINASPTISCPTNITVSNDPGLCGANVSFTGANAATANGTPTPSISYSPASGSFFPVGTTTVTATANNSCGNVQCTFTVVVNDNQPPETPTLANVTGECSATATVPTTTDNCAGTINGTTNDPLSYSTQGTHVIHWTFNDGNGNSITVNQNVIVDDVTDPATPTLANVTGECSATATVPTTTDNCAGTINGTTTDALSYNTQGTHVIHWTFNDGNGNSITVNQNVIVDDVTDPATPTLANVTGECSATATVPTTSDNCAGTINGTTNDPLSYSTQGTHVIHWTFNDGNGNSITVNQNVIVDDVTDPATPTLANVTGECSATATVPTTTDNCVGPINGTTTDPLSYNTQGTHVIHWTFNDGNGNSITVNQNVIVDDVTDPATPTLANVTGECSATATVPTTTDNCAGTINGTTTDALSYNTQGTHVIHWTFNDGNGNSTTANQNVIINDVTNPVITCPANTFIQYGSNESPSANGTASATDNCVVVSVGTPTDATVPGPGNNKTITRTWTATDIANNTASCNQIITVCDLSLSLGNNRYVFFGIPGLPGTTAVITATPSGGLTGVTYLWSSIQNPSVNGLTTQSITPTGYTDGQAVTYTVTATAPNGCTATKSVTITYFNINCSNNNNNVKVKVCHIPQGNPTNCNTICVSINAYQTLLNNGSYLGNCLPNCAMPPQTRGGVTDISQYLVGKQTLDVKVFNNPTQSYFGLFVYGDFYQRVSLRVIDMYGRVIDQKNNLNTEQEIRIGEGYIAGVYVVEVIQGVNKKVVKLVKQ